MRWIDAAIGFVLDRKLDKKQIIFIEENESYDLLDELASLKQEIKDMHETMSEFKTMVTRLSYDIDTPIELMRTVNKRVDDIEKKIRFR